MVSEEWRFIRWGLLGVLLLAASRRDLRTGECPDCLHLMIALSGLIGVSPRALPGMLAAGLIPGGLCLLAGLLSKGRLGGADIKLSTACGFFLGGWGGLIGLGIGALSAIAGELIKGNKKQGFPLIPYLSLGFMSAGLLQSI